MFLGSNRDRGTSRLASFSTRQPFGPSLLAQLLRPLLMTAMDGGNAAMQEQLPRTSTSRADSFQMCHTSYPVLVHRLATLALDS